MANLNLIAEQTGSTSETVLTVVIIVAMFCLPALVVWLTKRVRLFNTVGAIALCYALGFVFSLLPIPYNRAMTQQIASVLVAVAIPLILFTINLKDVKKLAKKTVLSFGLVIAVTAVVATAAFFVADAAGLANASQLAGMATGLYIGGTPNLVAIGKALISGELQSQVIMAANTSDFFVGGIYFLMLLTVVPPIYKRFLNKSAKQPQLQPDEVGGEPAAQPSQDGQEAAADEQAQPQGKKAKKPLETQLEYDYKSIPRDAKSIWKLIGVIALAIGCLGVGAGLEMLISGNLEQSLYLMVTVSVLGVAFSFIRPVREVKGGYQVGQYLVLVFSLGLSMSIDLDMLAKEILPTMAFFACVQICCALGHILLCKLFKIDAGTAIITSTAGIYGPPFIAPVANAYGDRNLIAPGIICGAVGLAVGNFIGMGVGFLLGLV